eukprot:GDKJ01017392.1.p1 GENE.GDKJ01017392.1~~GDKJ01017392.1.p1  ORF type:complete len:1038 (+),score=305.48 GDKJ01017392.1:129-3242(+)
MLNDLEATLFDPSRFPSECFGASKRSAYLLMFDRVEQFNQQDGETLRALSKCCQAVWDKQVAPSEKEEKEKIKHAHDVAHAEAPGPDSSPDKDVLAAAEIDVLSGCSHLHLELLLSMADFTYKSLSRYSQSDARSIDSDLIDAVFSVTQAVVVALMGICVRSHLSPSLNDSPSQMEQIIRSLGEYAKRFFLFFNLNANASTFDAPMWFLSVFSRPTLLPQRDQHDVLLPSPLVLALSSLTVNPVAQSVVHSLAIQAITNVVSCVHNASLFETEPLSSEYVADSPCSPNEQQEEEGAKTKGKSNAALAYGRQIVRVVDLVISSCLVSLSAAPAAPSLRLLPSLPHLPSSIQHVFTPSCNASLPRLLLHLVSVTPSLALRVLKWGALPLIVSRVITPPPSPQDRVASLLAERLDKMKHFLSLNAVDSQSVTRDSPLFSHVKLLMSTSDEEDLEEQNLVGCLQSLCEAEDDEDEKEDAVEGNAGDGMNVLSQALRSHSRLEVCVPLIRTLTTLLSSAVCSNFSKSNDNTQTPNPLSKSTFHSVADFASLSGRDLNSLSAASLDPSLIESCAVMLSHSFINECVSILCDAVSSTSCPPLRLLCPLIHANPLFFNFPQMPLSKANRQKDPNTSHLPAMEAALFDSPPLIAAMSPSLVAQHILAINSLHCELTSLSDCIAVVVLFLRTLTLYSLSSVETIAEVLCNRVQHFDDSTAVICSSLVTALLFTSGDGLELQRNQKLLSSMTLSLLQTSFYLRGICLFLESVTAATIIFPPVLLPLLTSPSVDVLPGVLSWIDGSVEFIQVVKERGADVNARNLPLFNPRDTKTSVARIWSRDFFYSTTKAKSSNMRYLSKKDRNRLDYSNATWSDAGLSVKRIHAELMVKMFNFIKSLKQQQQQQSSSSLSSVTSPSPLSESSFYVHSFSNSLQQRANAAATWSLYTYRLHNFDLKDLVFSPLIPCASPTRPPPSTPNLGIFAKAKNFLVETISSSNDDSWSAVVLNASSSSQQFKDGGPENFCFWLLGVSSNRTSSILNGTTTETF